MKINFIYNYIDTLGDCWMKTVGNCIREPKYSETSSSSKILEFQLC